MKKRTTARLVSIILAGLALAAAPVSGLGAAKISLEVLGRYSTDQFARDAAIAVAHDSLNQRLYVVNRHAGGVDVLDLLDPADPTPVGLLDVALYGPPTAVAVRNGIVAVAAEATVKTDPGHVIFFDTALFEIGAIQVGALPDMLTFTADGRYLLVANEGELDEISGIDPPGSVSIIDVAGGIDGLTVNDGDLDLVTGGVGPVRLYLNDGDGTPGFDHATPWKRGLRSSFLGSKRPGGVGMLAVPPVVTDSGSVPGS